MASETLTGVTQLKIGDVCLLASERSERDTLRGNAIEISLYLFIYLSVYGVRETSVFARASNYVSLVKRLQFQYFQLTSAENHQVKRSLPVICHSYKPY